MTRSNVKKRLFSVFKVAMMVLSLAMLSHCKSNKMPVQGEPQGPKEFIPFEQFLTDTQKAKFEDFSRRAGSKVLNDAEFLKMKKHIISLYEGVVVKNSFVMDNNGHVDCIDMNTQPGLRQGGKQLTIQKPPKTVVVQEYDEEPKAQPVQPMLDREKKDRFGNLMFCESGFIPMRRITLDELTRFKTLEDFFNKFGKAGTSDMPGEK
jgi:hypothetical protein